MALYSAIIGLLREGGNLVDFFGALSAIVSLATAFVGFLVLIYIANLRMDAILYARTVNAIRKHFYDDADLNIEIKLRTRVLPQTASLPAYSEKSFFLPVVVSFAIFNSMYIFLSLVLLSTPLTDLLGSAWTQILEKLSAVLRWSWPFISIFFALHLIAYLIMARYREHSYLKSFAVGIDIDGVISDHAPHFCKLLYELCHKQLKPEQITSIPVHENKALHVTRKDEKTVFNSLQYWTAMPCKDGAAYNIQKLRNLFKMKVYLFTYRPWPSEEVRRRKHAYSEWKETASQLLDRPPSATSRLLCRMRRSNHVGLVGKRIVDRIIDTRMETGLKYLESRPIDTITRFWLYSCGIHFDSLIIERGSEDISDPQGEFRNRFYISRKRKLRFFIEDDAEKAVKLSYICDIVFLMDQPYNRDRELPSNILRMDSWDDIYRSIRKLS